MELRHLRYFLAVARAGSFTRAAERCGVAQSALSEQIARLETEVGTALVHRTSRRVSLTPAGEALRPLAARVLADAEQAMDRMAALTNVRQGRLRMGAVQAAPGELDLVELARAYTERHPAVELRVRSAASRDMAAAVQAGELDLAILALPAEELPSGLTHHALAADPIVAVMSAEAARDSPVAITLPDLVSRGPFAHFMARSGLRLALDAAFARAGIAEPGTFELDQVSDLIRLAASGVAVTAVPASAVGQAIAEHGITSVAVRSLADEEAVHPVGVVYDAERLSPVAEAMLELLLAIGSEDGAAS